MENEFGEKVLGGSTQSVAKLQSVKQLFWILTNRNHFILRRKLMDTAATHSRILTLLMKDPKTLWNTSLHISFKVDLDVWK